MLLDMRRASRCHVRSKRSGLPALEGFSPTPEMPEIAEAEALLAALTETDEVKARGPRGRRPGGRPTDRVLPETAPRAVQNCACLADSRRR